MIGIIILNIMWIMWIWVAIAKVMLIYISGFVGMDSCGMLADITTQESDGHQETLY